MNGKIAAPVAIIPLKAIVTGYRSIGRRNYRRRSC